MFLKLNYNKVNIESSTKTTQIEQEPEEPEQLTIADSNSGTPYKTDWSTVIGNAAAGWMSGNASDQLGVSVRNALSGGLLGAHSTVEDNKFAHEVIKTLHHEGTETWYLNLSKLNLKIDAHRKFTSLVSRATNLNSNSIALVRNNQTYYVKPLREYSDECLNEIDSDKITQSRNKYQDIFFEGGSVYPTHPLVVANVQESDMPDSYAEVNICLVEFVGLAFYNHLGITVGNISGIPKAHIGIDSDGSELISLGNSNSYYGYGHLQGSLGGVIGTSKS